MVNANTGMTLKHALWLCGLTQKEAAGLFGYTFVQVRNWCGGKAKPPNAIWDQIRDTHRRIHAGEIEGLPESCFHTFNALNAISKGSALRVDHVEDRLTKLETVVAQLMFED